MSNKLNLETVKKEIHDLYNGEYDCLSKEYINNKSKLNIIHYKCKNIFKMSRDGFINRKNKCPFCMNKLRGYKNSFDYDYVKNYIEQNKDYKLISKSYNNYKEKLTIKHKDHIFKMSFDSFKNQNQRCPLCSSNKKYTIQEVKDLINNLTDGEYDCLSEEYINNKSKLDIIHYKCGNVYKANLNNFLNKHNRCPICLQNSKGEKIISEILTKNGIEFKTQYRFKECKDKRSLPFDFYLEDFNTCIEYDGELHFNKGRYFKNDEYNISKLKDIIKHDNIKNEFCKNNNINLIRINYKDFNSIESIIEQIIKNK